ncbi:ankyrin repeat and IBR domain-containing protein 1-like [Tribolium madens]|uniref:ankyrin repeat and IBR domain-containing protein 1-like n=1 Tax=Tribolium madens TaxID=41895 RepID=UPI001CF744FA|nr:ankyrin repeat and IBR domain-containing protein 1-like [Tribolium madens]
MGSTSSKFKKYLQHGDEFAAMQIYQSSPELRKNLDPNLSYGENHNHNTALHYAAKHGMKHLLRTFLNDLGGNPNKKNGLNESVLHSACQLNQTKSFSAQERRAACVQLLLFWKGGLLANGGRERVDLSSQDKEGNTALHWAASTGLKRCVELLLAHGAPLFIENNDKLTPCDLAMRGSHHDIARLLESRMVFADNADLVNEDEIITEQEEVYSGLRSQDLQEAKDQLLVDTSDMLKIPLFTAEALLRNNEWSRELLLEKWMKDPVECCQIAGVQAPSSVLKHAGSLESSISAETNDENELMCEICLSTISNWEQPVKMSCKHSFCKTCWESYLTTKIQDGDAHHILCPAYQCHILVPVELIEKLVSPDMARRYLQFDIKAFVESNKSIKWCPIAGCGRAVRLPEAEQTGNRVNNKSAPITSHAVDCGNAHFFCWECLGEAHAPCGCKQWQEWQIKIAEIKPEELKASCSGSEDAANCLWLVTNSKPCPNCKSPIQKNEGCNHMKCSKCKFDFCWVCQESWKRHSSATGGYFRCNRFEAVHKADEKQGNLISEALDRNNQMQEMSRFLHFYTRFRNHENSQKLEEPLLTSVRQKREVLASSLGLKSTEDSGEKGTKFIEDGVRELLKARRVLCGSYVYGYYLEDDGYNKAIFEFMQNELEEVTEKLSEMIARPYLRTPKAVIVQTTALARRKRHEFVRAVAQGLIPPETPPTQRKRKRKYLDTDLTQTSAWLRDCEWPENDSDEDNEVSFKQFSGGSPNSKEHQCGFLCSRHGCGRSDYNMELIIALEMSRLQMIEDRMKQAQANAITPDPSSSISNNSNESADDQLKLAIQLSLQESGAAEEAVQSQPYQKSSADWTVDYFLKSLANHKIDLKSLDVNKLNPETDRELFFRPCNGNEDGRFQISDIHEKGFAFEDVDDYDDADVGLKRSHSTGDLCVRRSGRGTRVRMNGDEPRYHLDSDHSSQHDDKPEDLARKILALPSTSVRTKQFLLLHHTYPEEESYQGQSSIEDTTTSDSINADMEVCGILSSVTDEDIGKSYNEEEEIKKTEMTKIVECKKQTHNPFASLKAKLCSAHLPKTSYLTRIAVNKSIGLLSSDHKVKKNCDILKDGRCKSEKHSPKSIKHQKCCRDSSFSKSTGFLLEDQRKNCNLRIKICKSPDSKCRKSHTLETDSSNEYESETGIPKSPTLFISGVSISRTPEPKSPGMILISGGRQSRSSSLSVPVPLTSCSLNISSTSLNNTLPPEPFTPSLVRSTTPANSRSNIPSPSDSSPKKEANAKSKSASEPEREREMFRFPKSSTDGALSSVLHIQESNLSSDDFHEALFLLERSPKTRDSKRRKKSKKNKEKDDKKEDVSSVL